MENYSKSEPANLAVFPAATETPRSSVRSRWIGWSSFFFAVVQSVCTAFVALSGVRILIGAVAFGSALGLIKIADKLHVSAIRVPMMLVALFGSLFNLAAIWQVRRLRGRSASAWRQKPLSNKKRNSERLQVVLSVLTVALLALEYYFHIKLHKG
jgi:cytochrome bd-type quinol oxidase subunit 2